MNNEISYEDSIKLSQPLFIDVRSPSEFLKDHIPGSINMAIFNDDERDEIGKIYNLLGRDDAIIKGSEIAGLKIGDIVSNIKKIRDKDIIIYCFRGGMRSSSLVSLLYSLDFNVMKLKEGYKGYRRYVSYRLNNIDIKPKVFVLHGLTGTGKTEIIRRLTNSIDLEGIAGHRSSVFGGLGLKQKSQKMFESLLLKRIDDLNMENYIIIEGESRKVGNIHIPPRIVDIIYNSSVILIKASIDRRVKILLKEYTPGLNSDEVISIVESLAPRIGCANTNHFIELFKRYELYEFTKLLLQKYYDPLYKFSLKDMKFIAEIENIDTDTTVRQVEEVISQNV